MTRSHVSLIFAVLCVLSASAAEPVVKSKVAKPVASTPFAAELLAILTDGFDSRTDIAEIKSHVSRAHSLEPKNPAVDYSFGLVLLKRLQNQQAVEQFQAALEVDPTYLPARAAILRMHLLAPKKDAKTLISDATEFAGVIGDDKVTWRDEQQRAESAAFLGRIVVFSAGRK